MRGGFTTRAGGVSTAPWDRLNLALHVDDEPRHVLANRDLLGRSLGGSRVHFPHQIHGAGVAVVDTERAGRRRITLSGAAGADALVTRLPAVPIGVLVADCLPILLADIAHGVIGAAHAGRTGLASGVLPATVSAMTGLGATPERIVAVIGPAVCGRCYEVPATMREDIERQVPGSAATTRDGTPSLDLPAGAAGVLERLGVGTVRRIAACTMEDVRFFSYRRDGVTGRFAGVVMLTDGG